MDKNEGNKDWEDWEDKKTVSIEVSGKQLANFETYFSVGAICNKHLDGDEHIPTCKECVAKKEKMIKEMQEVTLDIWEKYVNQFENGKVQSK